MSRLIRPEGRGRRRLLASAAAILLLAAAGTLAVAVADQHHAPQPAASAALPGTGLAAPSGARPSPGTVAASPTRPPAPALPSASRPVAPPVALSIPAIGVQHALLQLGHNPDGTLQVPPLSNVAAPGWDRDSPKPGAVGPAVIVGHVDGSGGGVEGVFYRLGALRPGDTVSVSRSDGTVALFRIDGVNEYPKNAFPTLAVYGNTTDPQLRLITCGGRFDQASGHYLDNIVAYATLTDVHPA